MRTIIEDNSISWTKNNVNYYLTSNTLSPNEMRTIAVSMNLTKSVMESKQLLSFFILVIINLVIIMQKTKFYTDEQKEISSFVKIIVGMVLILFVMYFVTNKIASNNVDYSKMEEVFCF